MKSVICLWNSTSKKSKQPVIVTNSSDYNDVDPIDKGTVRQQECLLSFRKQKTEEVAEVESVNLVLMTLSAELPNQNVLLHDVPSSQDQVHRVFL